MPEKEEYAKGHKYPYYSCDILCSINGLNLEKLLNTHNEDNNNDNIDKKNDNSSDEERKENKDNNDENKENFEKNNEKIENIENSDKNKNEEDENSERKEILDENENNDIKEDDEKEVDIKKTVDEKMDLDDEECEDDKTLKDKKKDEPNYSLLYSVLDHFFSFLKIKSSLDNYVLMGYFNKITNYLIKTKTKIILDYILIKRENIINELLSHINRYSISNIIINILNALSEDNTPDANDKYLLDASIFLFL